MIKIPFDKNWSMCKHAYIRQIFDSFHSARVFLHPLIQPKNCQCLFYSVFSADNDKIEIYMYIYSDLELSHASIGSVVSEGVVHGHTYTWVTPESWDQAGICTSVFFSTCFFGRTNWDRDRAFGKKLLDTRYFLKLSL